jgi:multiple antibiotic resistance protein
MCYATTTIMTTLQAAILLFLVIDPLGNVPFFLAAVRHLPPERQRAVILREMVVALGILLFVLVAGGAMMGYLGLSQPAVGIAGGLILFLIGVRMIFPVQGGVFGEVEEVGREPLIVPLAVPLIAGPSAMATLMLMAAREPERIGDWTYATIVAWLVSTLILATSPWIGRRIPAPVIAASVRLIGMLLVAVSVQQFLDGLQAWRLTG